MKNLTLDSALGIGGGMNRKKKRISNCRLSNETIAKNDFFFILSFNNSRSDFSNLQFDNLNLLNE